MNICYYLEQFQVWTPVGWDRDIDERKQDTLYAGKENSTYERILDYIKTISWVSGFIPDRIS